MCAERIALQTLMQHVSLVWRFVLRRISGVHVVDEDLLVQKEAQCTANSFIHSRPPLRKPLKLAYVYQSLLKSLASSS